MTIKEEEEEELVSEIWDKEDSDLGTPIDGALVMI
jgi:hypothetical protein